MNRENNKKTKPHKVLLGLPQILDLRSLNKHVVL